MADKIKASFCILSSWTYQIHSVYFKYCNLSFYGFYLFLLVSPIKLGMQSKVEE